MTCNEAFDSGHLRHVLRESVALLVTLVRKAGNPHRINVFGGLMCSRLRKRAQLCLTFHVMIKKMASETPY